ncbi:uracil-DNA glycosylase family protein [Fodinicola feengrottensis]|uniref:Type-5 uracil-DNA glycosylase n=1 Tax=Fodinicola feengrottensis TaxID=435914 RepID=A0ABN2HGE3_9ACTN
MTAPEYLTAPERDGVPVAGTAAAVRRFSRQATDLPALDDAIACCRACDRLVAWRERVAVEKRAAYVGETYWGRPAPGFGPPDARIAVLGLAPAAHGANRTGRVFTGDRSGDWLFAAMHRAGLANQPTSVRADDGLRLIDARIVAAVRCAPPENKPTPAERDTCQPWLVRELALLRPTLRVVVVLGGFGWAALWPSLVALGIEIPRPRPTFGHGVEVDASGLTIVGCFHPSQQNTFTGKLTESMLDDIFRRANEIVAA